MKYLLIVLCLCLPACVSSTESGVSDTTDDTVSTVEFDRWLALRCPADSYLEIRNRDTGDVIASPPCTEVRDVALADEGTRVALLNAFHAQRDMFEQSTSGQIGEARQPGIIGFLLGLAAMAYVNYKCEKQRMGWMECTAAGVPVALTLSVLPF